MRFSFSTFCIEEMNPHTIDSCVGHHLPAVRLYLNWAPQNIDYFPRWKCKLEKWWRRTNWGAVVFWASLPSFAFICHPPLPAYERVQPFVGVLILEMAALYKRKGEPGSIQLLILVPPPENRVAQNLHNLRAKFSAGVLIEAKIWHPFLFCCASCWLAVLNHGRVHL